MKPHIVCELLIISIRYYDVHCIHCHIYTEGNIFCHFIHITVYQSIFKRFNGDMTDVRKLSLLEYWIYSNGVFAFI